MFGHSDVVLLKFRGLSFVPDAFKEVKGTGGTYLICSILHYLLFQILNDDFNHGPTFHPCYSLWI